MMKPSEICDRLGIHFGIVAQSKRVKDHLYLSLDGTAKVRARTSEGDLSDDDAMRYAGAKFGLPASLSSIQFNILSMLDFCPVVAHDVRGQKTLSRKAEWNRVIAWVVRRVGEYVLRSEPESGWFHWLRESQVRRNSASKLWEEAGIPPVINGSPTIAIADLVRFPLLADEAIAGERAHTVYRIVRKQRYREMLDDARCYLSAWLFGSQHDVRVVPRLVLVDVSSEGNSVEIMKPADNVKKMVLDLARIYYADERPTCDDVRRSLSLPQCKFCKGVSR